MARITKTVGFECSDGTSFTAIENAQQHQAVVNLTELFGPVSTISISELADRWYEVHIATKGTMK